MLENGAECSIIDASQDKCKLTGKTEEVWVSKNLLKVKYTQKESVTPSGEVQGVELTIVYWISKGTKSDDGSNSYTEIPKPTVDEIGRAHV